MHASNLFGYTHYFDTYCCIQVRTNIEESQVVNNAATNHPDGQRAGESCGMSQTEEHMRVQSQYQLHSCFPPPEM